MLSEDPYWRIHNCPMPDVNAIKQRSNLYAYCANNPLSFIDPDGLDMRILVCTNSAEIYDGGLAMGHMGVMVQNATDEWYYFSAGSDYVQFKPVAEEYLQDLEKFSKEYYGGYSSVGAYDKSVYIKGDFTKSFDHYNTYNTNNIATQNKNSYKLLTNNCSHVVIEGFGKGTLADGTNAGWFIVERMGYQYMYPSFPKEQIDDFQHIFYNEAFTCEEYHSQLNKQLWEYRNSSYPWNKSETNAKIIERIK